MLARRLRIILLFCLALAELTLGRFDQAECDVTKGCLSSRRAKVRLSWAPESNGAWSVLELETYEQMAIDSYVAVAFSEDRDMGRDLVLACTPHSAAVVLGVNPRATEATLVETKDLNLTTFERTSRDGVIYCRFALPLEVVPSVGSLPFGDLAKPYHLMLASGPSKPSQLVGYHSGTKEVFAARTNVAEALLPPATTAGVTRLPLVTSSEASSSNGSCGTTEGCFGLNGMVVSYSCQGSCDTISMRIRDSESGPDKYAAVGFSYDQRMGLDYVVWCNTADRIVRVGFNPSGTTPTVPAPRARGQLLVGAPSEYSLKDGNFTCAFQLKTAVFGVSGFTNITSLDQPLHLLVARGNAGSEAMGYHSMRGSSEQRHSVGSSGSYLAEGEVEVTSEGGQTGGPRKVDATTGGPEASAERLVTGKVGCGVSAHCWEAASAAMSFTPVDGGVDVVVELADAEVKADEYIALAFSDDRAMGQDYVVWCQADSRALFTGFNPNSHEATTPVATARNLGEMTHWERMDAHLGCRFNLKVDVVMQGLNKVDTLAKELYLQFAKGRVLDEEKTIARHNYKLASPQKYLVTDTANFKVATPSEPLFTFRTKDALIRAHGGLMVIAWIFCLTATILVARYCKNWPERKVAGAPLWFQAHKWGNAVGLGLVVVAFVLIFLAKEGKWTGPTKRNPDSSPGALHSIIGMVACILAFLQPFVALVRPHPNTKNRKVFLWVHRSIGLLAWVLSAAALYYATRFDKLRGKPVLGKKRDNLATGGWIAYVVVLGMVTFGLEAHLYYCEKRPKVAAATGDEMAMDARGDGYKPPPRAPANPHRERVRKPHIRSVLFGLFAIAATAASLLLISLLAIHTPTEEPKN